MENNKLTTRHGLVGPASLWQDKRKFQFDFLTQSGLKPGHTLLDFGCGTLRGGIPLIKYLEPGNYTGIEIRPDVLHEAHLELQEAGLTEKKPLLLCVNDISKIALNIRFDYVWAFSVLIHLSDEILSGVLKFISNHLTPGGLFFANVVTGRTFDGHWKQFPLVEREESFYRAVFMNNGLTLHDIGPLEKFGHISGTTDPELRKRQRMFKSSLC